jgi:AmmeMemoRadiSam system protein B
MVRLPAVAGRFYPAEPGTLSSTVAGFLNIPHSKRRALGIVVPHAGYIYSGAVAGAVYSQISLPGRSIILCPNHTGFGRPLAVMREGSWRTPLGDLQIDTEMCDALLQTDPDLEDDAAAHKYEHALEVQLPFLQHLITVEGSEHRFVPIVVGTGDFGALSGLGQAIAETIARIDPSTIVIASSDMNHYESETITRIKDSKAIDQVLKRDPKGLWQTVRQEKISMCGVGPATSMLVAANLLHADQAELVSYATSAKTSGDFERVVGYAGVILEGPAE